MPLTRYYILENDTTTAGGIVQTTTNPIIFNVGGKKQSCIGDNVWCPACQSMGQIIPTGPRLSFSLGGAMPALNDDLCLCKCSPSPKLVHSQTSFKEIIDDNRLAQYRQAQAQYRQAKLQNNLANATSTDDDLPKFTVHFRRPDDYKGEYGFDWLRDEYIYSTNENGSIQNPSAKEMNANDFFEQYRTHQNQSVTIIDELLAIQPEYVPAWLSIFPKSRGVHTRGISLLIEIEQNVDDGNITALKNNNIELLLECSPELQIDTTTIPLDDYLNSASQQELQLLSGELGLDNKHIYRYTNQKSKINIVCNQPFSKVGHIKIFAKKDGIKKQVGLLCVYPNSEIKKAVIQPVFINTIHPESKTHPLKMDGEDKLTQSELSNTIKYQLLNQALIQAEVQPIQILDLYEDFQIKEIERFLLKYKHTDNNNNLKDYLNDIERRLSKDKDTLDFLHDVIELYNILTNNNVHNHQNITYLFLVDYIYDDDKNSDAGIALADFTNKQAIHLCRTDNICNHWKNVSVVFLNSDKMELLHTVRHELGHSFGLSHTFRHYPNEVLEMPIIFDKGSTDNIMDYIYTNHKDYKGHSTLNIYTDKMFSLFKWQWDKMHNDSNLLKQGD